MPLLSLEQLRTICPNLPRAKAELYLPYLNEAMVEDEVNTRLRMAAFLAQGAEENVEFEYLEEIASGDTYEPTSSDPGARRRAKRLGNTQKGDGRRYKGRGMFQLTGRDNYRACGSALGVDLITRPELAATPRYAFKVGCWYWKKKNINAAADAEDFEQVTRLINGGLNGLKQRQKYYARALQVLT